MGFSNEAVDIKAFIRVYPCLELRSSLSTVRPHRRSDAEPEASHAGSEVQREPDHSEGADSQKIGRELEASNALP